MSITHTILKPVCLGLAICGTLIASADVHEATITINDKITYQHVTGFGGFSPSPTWQYWLGTAEMNKLFGKGENQLGLNILRLYMANSRNGWSSGVSNAKAAKRHGAFIFASPWSPPASWKSNGSDSNGGELLESRYEDWANFLNDYYKYMKEQGVEIDAVSIQNEPDWRADYQSCIWSGDQMAKFLKDYGSLIECKVIAPEAIHFTRSMHEPILNDAEACAQLDILGGHFYGWDGSSYPLAAQKGKEVWMTEYLINERQQNEGKNINWEDDGFLFARSINDAMLANMSAWVHYSLKRYYGCLGDGTYGTVNNEITKRGYILSHYAKYVSGTTRVRHSLSDPTGKLSASAYHTESGDSIVLMVLNPTPDYYTTAITLPFNNLYYKEIVTNASSNMVKTDYEFETETYLPEIDIEPYSVSTYIFPKSSPRDGQTDIEPELENIFSDNFDIYGASCIPQGWRVKFEDGTRTPGEYSLGPRIMSFSNEGMMSHALYFRTTTSVGYAAYGLDSNYRLSLEPGKYILNYDLVGWKTKPAITASVQKTGGKAIASQVTVPEYSISTNGSSSRITDATTGTLEFEITDAANYVLKWEVAAASAGMNEALLGNIRLYKSEETGIEDIITDAEINDSAIYDITGRRVVNPTHPGIYICNGKKIVK